MKKKSNEYNVTETAYLTTWKWRTNKWRLHWSWSRLHGFNTNKCTLVINKCSKRNLFKTVGWKNIGPKVMQAWSALVVFLLLLYLLLLLLEALFLALIPLEYFGSFYFLRDLFSHMWSMCLDLWFLLQLFQLSMPGSRSFWVLGI